MTNPNLMILKKKVNAIKTYKGQGTQLISLYLPPEADRSTATKQLTDEMSQSANIKSAQTRKNVQSALKRIINYLKQIDFKLPETGLVLFAGDVSTNPSKSDVVLLIIVPPTKLTTKLYWCDSTFHIDPLEDMVQTDDVYGLIVMDKREATVAILRGKLKEIIFTESSNVPGKTKAGGQCLKDAFISLSNGEIIDISKVSKDSFISSVDFKKSKLINSVVKVQWCVSKNKTYTLKTKSPFFEIKASEDHTFFVLTENGITEKLAKDLTLKDILLFPEKINTTSIVSSVSSKNNSFNKNTDFLKLPKTLTPSLARLLGYLHFSQVSRNNFSMVFKNKDAAFSCLSLIKSFNINPSFSQEKNSLCYKISFSSPTLASLIKKEFKVSSKNPLVPSKILTSSNKILSSFLSGLYDVKGSLSSHSINLSLKSKALSTQLSIALLRFSIISSLKEGSSSRDQGPSFSLSISDSSSVSSFEKFINFSSSFLQERLALLKSRTKSQRLLPVYGKEVKTIFSSHSVSIPSSKKLISFFNNKSFLTKEEFKFFFLDSITNKSLLSVLTSLYNTPFYCTSLSSISIDGSKTKMYDLSVLNQSFIANCLIVHNSAHRFERLRDKYEEEFYKRIGAKVNTAFTNIENLKGVIIGGPGLTKQEFIEQGDLDHRVKDKILGTVDTSYTDEYGIKEVLDKSEELLRETGLIQERKLISKFLESLAKNSLAVYGFQDVLDSLSVAKVSTVLISEALDWTVLKFKCLSNNSNFIKVVKNKYDVESVISKIENSNSDCEGAKAELVEEIDLYDYFLEISQNTNAKVELISVDTVEGKQFMETFGGIGGFLRYR